MLRLFVKAIPIASEMLHAVWDFYLHRAELCQVYPTKQSLTSIQTRDVISQRQSRTLLEMSEEIPRARNTDSYWNTAIDVLSRNTKDVPFALLYAADADRDDSSSSRTRFSDNNQQCTLKGSIGLPKGSPAGPAHLEVQQDHGFTPYFRLGKNLAHELCARHTDCLPRTSQL